MGKIGDLWVRLGLKSDDYKKGMKDAKKETSNFSQNLGKMKATAIAVWAAVGSAVVQFSRDFINATNKVNDAWNNTIAGIKAGVHNIHADLSNISLKDFFKDTEGFKLKSLFNAAVAGKAAKEMSKAFDAEFELTHSVRLQKAMIQDELNELHIAMRDTALSPAEQKAAAERYKALLQPLADAEVRIYGNMLETASTAWQMGQGLSRIYTTDEMREFFANYGTDTAGMTEKYSELARVYESRKGDKQNKVIYDILTQLEVSESQMSEVEKTLSRAELAINKRLAALGEEFNNMLVADLQAGLEDVEDAVDDIEDVQIVMPEIDLSALDAADAQIKKFVDDWQKEQQEIAQLNGMLSDAIVSSISNGVQGFTDMLFGLEGADAKGVLAALMQPFADTATQLGGMLLAQGIAVEAFKTSLASLQGAPAIAAGLSLLAIGAAMKSGIQALAGGGAGAGTSASYGGSSYSSSTDVANYESTLTVYVEGKVSGSDILLAGSNQQKKWNR